MTVTEDPNRNFEPDKMTALYRGLAALFVCFLAASCASVDRHQVSNPAETLPHIDDRAQHIKYYENHCIQGTQGRNVVINSVERDATDPKNPVAFVD
jgi:hypothetical protein